MSYLRSGTQLKVLQRTSSSTSGDIFSSRASFIVKLADESIVADADGSSPCYKPYTYGRIGVAPPNAVPDCAIITQPEYEEVLRLLNSTISQKRAKDQRVKKTTELGEIESFVKNHLQSVGIYLVVNGTEWPLVTTPFYSDPSGFPIIVGDGFIDHARRTKKTRCEKFAKQHKQLDAFLTMLLWTLK